MNTRVISSVGQQVQDNNSVHVGHRQFKCLRRNFVRDNYTPWLDVEKLSSKEPYGALPLLEARKEYWQSSGVEPSSNSDDSLISELSNNVSLASGMSNSHVLLQGSIRAGGPPARESVREKYMAPIAGRQFLVKSDNSRNYTEPVNFSKDVFDTYSTSFPTKTDLLQFYDYQIRRFVEVDRTSTISFITSGIEH